jgi:hypothetical protein
LQKNCVLFFGEEGLSWAAIVDSGFLAGAVYRTSGDYCMWGGGAATAVSLPFYLTYRVS